AMRAALVVIPTLNESDTIVGVLEALAADPPPDAALRFVVADGGSTDGTIECVREIAAQRCDVFLLHNPQRIQSAAVNRAVFAHGDGADVLIRCDAHAIYPSGYCRR